MAVTAVLAFVLASCTGTQAGSDVSPAREVNPAAQTEQGQDLGNGRPVVSYDGLMVRRRIVLAVHSNLDADLAGIRMKLDVAAAAQGVALTDIPPTVLEPVVLQHTMPELIVALPPSASVDQAYALADQATADGTEGLGADHLHVLPVLVHDLRFTISTQDPTALSAAVNREGILSDYLGNYETTTAKEELGISYTGPLLGDDIVENVRDAIAREAHATAQAIAVEPRSTTGTGVDMETEPPWEPETLKETDNHTRH